MKFELFNILIFIFISLFICLILVIISNVIIVPSLDYEKLSVHECGFDPSESTIEKFDVKSYSVSIIFISFDLEISFLFPWVLILPSLTIVGHLSMSSFPIILVLGFAYEWNLGVLDW